MNTVVDGSRTGHGPRACQPALRRSRMALVAACMTLAALVADPGLAVSQTEPVDPTPPPTAPLCRGRVATIVAVDGIDTMGTSGDDVIVGTGGDDVIVAGGGDDLVCGLGGNDQVIAGPGADEVVGGRGNDRITGGAGNDRIRGGAGRDRAHGGSGRDRVQGGGGIDRCTGGLGLDRALGCERLAAPQRRPVVHAIGDSVMLGATDPYCGALRRAMPGVVEDAEVSRHFVIGLDLVSGARQTTSGEVVFVIGLGTNGPFSADALDSLIAAGGRSSRFVFVNTHVPLTWEAEVNQAIADGVARHAHRATLVDWKALASSNPSLTGSDDIHLTCDGAAAYADAVAAGVRVWS